MAPGYDRGNRLIAALDVADGAEAERLAERIGDAAGFVKLGLELFAAEGPALVRRFTDGGRRVMLNLKLHDIPATVERATERLAALGVELLTVHAGGGAAMIAGAVAAARRAGGAGRPRILAVTVLTSLDAGDLAAVGVAGALDDQVARLGRLAIDAGADGLVCSPHEAARLRRELGDGVVLVTPGVRPAGAATGDQKRVMTAAEAARAGADLVVVGRPIRDAADPAAAARAIAAELADA